MMQFDTSTRIRDAAVKVASGYLARGEALTEGVVKVASEQGLNATQARRVCERANHLVHAALRKQANVVEFPLADPSEVEAQMGAKEKVATHYFVPHDTTPEAMKTAAEKECDDDDVEDDDDKKKVKAREKEHENLRKKEVEKEKEASLREAEFLADQAFLDAQAAMHSQFLKVATENRVPEVMEAIVEYAPLAAKPELMLEVAKLAKLAHLQAWGEPTSFTDRTMELLTTENLEKVASEVDPDLVNPGLQIGGMPVNFIRGRHAIWASIDTLLNAYMSALCAHDAVARAQLAPDHTRAEFMRNGVTHKATREYTVAGRGI